MNGGTIAKLCKTVLTCVIDCAYDLFFVVIVGHKFYTAYPNKWYEKAIRSQQVVQFLFSLGLILTLIR